MQRRIAAAALGMLLALLAFGGALAAGPEGGGLGAGPIIGIVIAIGLSLLLIGGSLGYILPKPPKR